MKRVPPEEPHQEEAPTKPTRSEVAYRMIEEYVNDLRAIIKKLRQKMN